MLFAKKDIEELNLKVKAGHLLPDRFQSFQSVKSLKETLGEDAIVEVTPATTGFILMPENYIESLQNDLREAQKKIEKLESSRKNRE